MAEPEEQMRAKQTPAHELRRLTVLFCDIVSSTELGSQLDIEDYCAIIEDYKELCRRHIDGAGGWLAQFQGDGVLAYFGYPILYEDPARRAVHAGLRIIEEITSRSFQLPSGKTHRLVARASIHYGPVVTPSIREQSAQLPEGVTINIAKKIQQYAPLNGLVITGATADMVRRYFDLKGPTTVALDRTSTSLAVYEVVGERSNALSAQRRFDDSPPELVDRFAELELLAETWRLAQQGIGQSLVLLGEAGIGKSRLIHEFKRQNSIGDDAWCELRCTPDTTDSAFFPFREYLAARLAESAEGSTSLQTQATAHLTQLGLCTEANVKALLSLMGEAAEDDEEPVSPAVARGRINELLIRYFLARSSRHPLALFIDDLHWSDASTREIIEKFTLRYRGGPVLIVCAQRQDAGRPLAGRAEITSVVLSPLPPPYVKELVEHLRPDRGISERQAQRLFHLTGGNALFVEQYVSSGSGEREQDWQSLLNHDHSGSEILVKSSPPTLQELIAYRLEQQGEAKLVTQAAAVLGEYAQPDLLRKVLDVDEVNLDPLIDSLLQSNILTYTTSGARPALRFQHALIRDAAYDTLLGSKKRELHRRIAEELVRERLNDRLIPHEVIARHFAMAQRPRQSISHWREAAADALSRFANAEAMVHLREALAQVKTLPAGETDSLEIEIREALLVPMEAMRGWAAEETEQNLNRLLELQASRSDDIGVFGVYHGLCSMHGIRGEVTTALGYVEKMQAIADRTGDLALQILSLRVAGILHFLIADFQTSLRLFEKLASLYRADVRDRVSAYYPASPVAVGHAFSALAQVLMGEMSHAKETLNQAYKSISSEKDVFTKAYVEGFASSVWLGLGDYEKAAQSARNCLAIATANSFDYWVSWARITLGYARVALDSGDEEALNLLEEGLNSYRSTGSRQILPYALGLFADALIKAGKQERALSVIQDIQNERRGNQVAFFDDFNLHLLELLSAGSC